MPKRLVSEFIGSLLLVTTVIGSGIMGERLAGGNEALALLGNTIPTGAILVVIILIFGPVSGAHFNPAVTLAFLLKREITLSTALAYMPLQIAGGIAGTLLAHLMFELPLLQASTHVRSGLGQWTAEIVASFGLVITIFGCIRHRPEAVPYAVGLFITAGYWFTASTSFANPAVTIARGLTDTFSGIAVVNVPGFILAQLAGAVLAVLFASWIFDSDE
jgi:glycerol uptake facilitator-like aquaporin